MNPQNDNQMTETVKPSTALQLILGGTILYFGLIVLFAQLFVSML